MFTKNLFDLSSTCEQTLSTSLTDDLWKELHNSESWHVKPGDYSLIESEIGEKRNWEIIKHGYQNNKDMEIPIIAYLPEKNLYHLLSGNTRLCVAHAEGIRPQVIVLTVEDPNKKA
ncbi:MAG: hypothetical protein ACPGTS_00925 [Minisyncoccia bacterium]